MEFKEGMVVLAKAGRDAGSCYMVVRCEGGYCWIADGGRRKVAFPKKKNPQTSKKPAMISHFLILKVFFISGPPHSGLLAFFIYMQNANEKSIQIAFCCKKFSH